MRVLQIASTAGQLCGVGNFAVNLGEALNRRGLATTTITGLEPRTDSDLVILHHGWQLFADDDDVARYCRTSPVPTIMFAHYRGAERFAPVVDGFLELSPCVVAPTDVPTMAFAHPAWAPPQLSDRAQLKRRFGLPPVPVLGTSGFFATHRGFPQLLGRLLPHARRHGWFVDLVTSPWYRPTGDLIGQLEHLRRTYPDQLRYGTTFLDQVTLNQRLQACDLLWCWTDLPSTPYGSGSISDQYASGSRIVATDKVQHGHVLQLPNTVRAPTTLEEFTDKLIDEAASGYYPRHDPALLGWDQAMKAVTEFLHRVRAASRGSRLATAAHNSDQTPRPPSATSDPAARSLSAAAGPLSPPAPPMAASASRHPSSPHGGSPKETP